MAKAHGEQAEAKTSRREREKYQAKKPPRAGRSRALEKRKGDAQRGRGDEKSEGRSGRCAISVCLRTVSMEWNVPKSMGRTVLFFHLTQKKKPSIVPNCEAFIPRVEVRK